MAVIAARHSLLGPLWLVLVSALPLRADQASDVRAQITYMASALANGNPTDALTPFDKSFPEYSQLADYFVALTDSFDLVSAIDIVSEDDNVRETTLKLDWALQVSDRASRSTRSHHYSVTVQLKPIKGKWQIVRFAPVEMFNPQPVTASSQ